MIVIETCPKCGHDLLNTVICTYPPIPRKECSNCDWYWEGEREEIVRVPFGGNSYTTTTTNTIPKTIELSDYSDISVSTLNHADYSAATINTINNFAQSACDNCSSNPKNGGSGICHCTLGQIQITY